MDWKKVIKNLCKKEDIPYDVTFTLTGKGHFMTDDEISCDSKDLKVSAHKFILSMVSEVFNKMFHGSLPEKSEITITDCSYKSFKAMIDKIYNRVKESGAEIR